MKLHRKTAKVKLPFQEFSFVKATAPLRYGEFIALNTFIIQKLYKENQNLRDENRDINERLLRLEKIIEKQK